MVMKPLPHNHETFIDLQVLLRHYHVWKISNFVKWKPRATILMCHADKMWHTDRWGKKKASKIISF